MRLSWRAAVTLFGHQGGAADHLAVGMAPHFGLANSVADELLEQPWAFSVSRETDPDDDHQVFWRARAIPVYGNGLNVRDWLFVDDHVSALTCVLERGRCGETYLVGGNAERRNVDVVNAVCEVLDRLVPSRNGSSYRELISFVPDRPGHDFRYAIDSSKLRTELGWSPHQSFEKGLFSTVQDCNPAWWRPLLAKHDTGVRRDDLSKMRRRAFWSWVVPASLERSCAHWRCRRVFSCSRQPG